MTLSLFVRIEDRLDVFKPDKFLFLLRGHERQFHDLEEKADVVSVECLRDPDDFGFRQNFSENPAQIIQDYAASIGNQMIKPLTEPRDIKRLRLDRRDCEALFQCE